MFDAPTLLYLLAVGSGVVVTVALAARGPRLTAALALALTATCAFALALVLSQLLYGDNAFAVARLWCWAFFGHLPLGLLGLAVVLRRHRPLAIGLAGAAVVLLAVAVDAFVIEPASLEVTRLELPAPGLTRRVRIGIVADLQTDHVGAHERLALVEVMAATPDLILLPGDYLQVPGDRYEVERDKLRALFTEVGLSAPLGVYAVGGNMEWRDDWPHLFDGTAVQPLVGPIDTVDLGPLVLTGLDLRTSFDTRLHLPRPDARPHVVFGHAPDFALGDIDADLLVAGHTHGGQIQLPGLGPLVTLSHVPRAWAAGLTALGPERHLLVSRGVGMERDQAPRIRFLCRPEVVIVDLASTVVASAEPEAR